MKGLHMHTVEACWHAFRKTQNHQLWNHRQEQTRKKTYEAGWNDHKHACANPEDVAPGRELRCIGGPFDGSMRSILTPGQRQLFAQRVRRTELDLVWTDGTTTHERDFEPFGPMYTYSLRVIDDELVWLFDDYDKWVPIDKRRLYAFVPPCHGAYSYVVLDESEAQAREAIDYFVALPTSDEYNTNEWKRNADEYQLTVLALGQVFAHVND